MTKVFRIFLLEVTELLEDHFILNLLHVVVVYEVFFLVVLLI